MAENENYRLCGGTLFVLISAARKERPSKAENYNGIRSGISEPEEMFELVRIVRPDIAKPLETEKKTVTDATRDYKACTSLGGGFFNIKDSAVRKSFDDRIKSQYPEVLEEMVRFTRRFLSVQSKDRKDEYLVKDILELLEADDKIPESTEFYVCADGTTMTKAQILRAEELCLEALLLGMWHYAICVVESNKVGQDTYEAWCPKCGRAEREYTACLGQKSNKHVGITYHEIKSDEGTDSHAEEKSEKSEEAAKSSEDGDVIETLVQNDNLNQTINNPNVFQFTFNGSVGAVYGSVGKIENNYYGGGKNGE